MNDKITRPDYQFWKSVNEWTVKEAIWLIHDIEPKDRLNDLYFDQSIKASLSRTEEIISRSFRTGTFPTVESYIDACMKDWNEMHVYPSKFIEWCVSKSLPVQDVSIELVPLSGASTNSDLGEDKREQLMDHESFMKATYMSLDVSGDVLIKSYNGNNPWRIEQFGFGSKELDIFQRLMRNDDHCIDRKAISDGNDEAVRGRFRAVNKKLIEFFSKHYHVDFPKSFKIIDHPADKPKSFYKLIISEISSKPSNIDKNRLSDEIERLLKRLSLTSDYNVAQEFRGKIGDLVVDGLSSKLIDNTRAAGIYQEMKDADSTSEPPDIIK